MKINRLELIEKLKAMIKDREDAAAGRRALALIKVESKEKDYIHETGTAWLDFAAKVQDKVEAGRHAITMEDVPKILKDGWGDLRFFKPPTFRESDYVPRVGHLNTLLTFLESSPDEFVTTNALSQIGAPVRELMKP